VNDTHRAIGQAQLQGAVGFEPVESAGYRLAARLVDGNRAVERMRGGEPAVQDRFEAELPPAAKLEVELRGKVGGKGIAVGRRA